MRAAKLPTFLLIAAALLGGGLALGDLHPGGGRNAAQIAAGNGAALTSSASDIQPLGSQTLGNSVKAAPANHVHAHGNLAGGSLHAAAIDAGASGFMTGAQVTQLAKMAAAFTTSDATHFAAFGGTPAVLAAGYTQTYATAARTVPADTSHTITDSSGGTASTSTLAAQSVTAGGAVDPTAALLADVNAIFVVLRNNIATVNAELTLTKADALATKKLVNALISDSKSYGLAQ
jgi:hypothetical protein